MSKQLRLSSSIEPFEVLRNMEKLLVSVITLGFLLCLATGCSIPEGGFTDPSMEDLVHYSDIVVVGRVTEIIDDPSFWGSTSYVDTTYGAKVDVRCSYKGGVLPRIITIGEAGELNARYGQSLL